MAYRRRSRRSATRRSSQRNRARRRRGRGEEELRRGRSRRREAAPKQRRSAQCKAEGEAKDESGRSAVEAATEGRSGDDRRREARKTAEEYAAYVARIGLTKAKIDEDSFDRAAELLAAMPARTSRLGVGPPELSLQLGRSFLEERRRRSTPPRSRPTAFTSPPAIGTARRPSGICNRASALREFPQGEYVHAVAYDSQGERLAAGGSDGSVHVYRVADGELLDEARRPRRRRASASASRPTIATCSPAATTTRPDSGISPPASRRKCSKATAGGSGRRSSRPTASRSSPPAKTAKRSSGAGRLPIEDRERAVAGRRRQRERSFDKFTEFTSHRGPVYAARFSPDGRPDRHRRVRRPRPPVGPERSARQSTSPAASTAQPDPPAHETELLAHRGPVRTLAFAPDGKTLSSGGQDNVIVVWDLETAKPLEATPRSRQPCAQRRLSRPTASCSSPAVATRRSNSGVPPPTPKTRRPRRRRRRFARCHPLGALLARRPTDRHRRPRSDGFGLERRIARTLGTPRTKAMTSSPVPPFSSAMVRDSPPAPATAPCGCGTSPPAPRTCGSTTPAAPPRST